MRTVLLPIALLLPLPGSQSAPRVEPVRHTTCVRYYGLEGDVDPDQLRRCVAEIAWAGADARIVTGPSGVSSRPKSKFLVLELSTATTEKEVQAALKKASRKPVELAWTAFQGPERELPAILGYSGLECVVGMDNDMRWFDLHQGLARFFYVPGKLDEEDLRKRFTALYKPFDAGELGELVRETIEWRLAEPLEATAVKAARKSIAKLPGIRSAAIDAESRTLTAEVVYDGLRGATTAAAAAAPEQLPGRGFLADDLLAALEAAGIRVDPPEESRGK